MSIMKARYVGWIAVLVLGRLLLFVVGFIIIVTRGWGGLLGGGILH